MSRCAPDQIWNGTTCAPGSSRGSTGVGAGQVGEICEEGKVADGAGHCCYPDQHWGAESGRCRGTPRCPAGLLPQKESCVAECRKGQVHTKDKLHCCWPGQEWSAAIGACLGEAVCPSGTRAVGGACEEIVSCEAGKVLIDREHCCWPGQAWGIAGCTGNAVCGDGFVAEGNDCISRDVIDARARAAEEAKMKARAEEAEARLDARAVWTGARYTSAGLVYLHDRTIGDFTGHSAGYFMAAHLRSLPIRLHGLLSLGLFRADAGSGSFTRYSVGIAFAPLSIPNARTTQGLSVLNPYVGIDVQGTNLKIEKREISFAPIPTPRSSFGGLLAIGNVFAVIGDQHQGLTLDVNYAFQVFGSEWASQHRFMIAGTLSLF